MQKILRPYFAVILWLLLCSAATAVDLSNISKHTEKELFDRADGYFCGTVRIQHLHYINCRLKFQIT